MCNPDFQYFLITDADRYRILQEYFPSLVSVMASYPHAIQRADLIRYVLLYVYGGIYLDLDYVCLHNLGPLLQLPADCDVGLVPSNNIPSRVTNSIMVSRPRAAFRLHVIDATRKHEQRFIHPHNDPLAQLHGGHSQNTQWFSKPQGQTVPLTLHDTGCV